MPSRPRPFRPLGLLLPCLALALAASPAFGVGFEDGDVIAINVFDLGGSTSSAEELLDMFVVSPPPSEPPPPPSRVPAISVVRGTMSSVDLTSTGSVTSSLNQIGASQGSAAVTFVDNLFVTAEGIAAGTPLILEVTWNVSGVTEFSSVGNMKNRAKLLLQAEGLDLDPDPNAPPPPRQEWTRDRSNFTVEHFDDFGPVTFEFLLDAETPNFDGNLRLTATAGFLVGGPGSNFFGTYSASGNAKLTLEFVGATNLKTIDGDTLYRWTTNAQSGLVYGMRDDDPPSDPLLNVTPSAGGPKFSTLSWDTVATEFYLVQASPDGSNWTTITEVLGTGSPISIDVINPAPTTIYRLIVDFGSGHPTPAPLEPSLCVTRQATGEVLVAWPTNHWENYALNEILPDGSKSFLEFVQGEGGASWFEFPTTPPGRIFQVEAVLK